MNLEGLDATDIQDASKHDIEQTDETKHVMANKKDSIIENEMPTVKN